MERRNVLVIDDEPAVRAILKEFLESAGYAVTAADSALGAMDLVQRVQPCAILLDLGLPYRSGAVLLAELKADPRTAHISVIVVSAMPEVLTDERRATAVAVMAKPFDGEALLNAVRAACRSGD